jgi:propionyl-CoA carboxylase beta chain
MGSDGAVDILFGREIAESENPEETRWKLVQKYRDELANPYAAASKGYIEDVIDPRETRPKIMKALEMLKGKEVINPPKKHGNIPL